MSDSETGKIVRGIVNRAVWRLNLMEIVILISAALLSLLAGALTALLISELVGIPYRTFWTISSVLFFCILGCFVFLKSPKGNTEIQKSKFNDKE